MSPATASTVSRRPDCSTCVTFTLTYALPLIKAPYPRNCSRPYYFIASASSPSIRLSSSNSSSLSTLCTLRRSCSFISGSPRYTSSPSSVKYIRITRLSSTSRSLRMSPSPSSDCAVRVTREGSISYSCVNSPWLNPSLRPNTVSMNHFMPPTPDSRSIVATIRLNASASEGSTGCTPLRTSSRLSCSTIFQPLTTIQPGEVYARSLPFQPLHLKVL